MREDENTFVSGNSFSRQLTDRECEVLKLVVMGKSNTEIAEELSIIFQTAKYHVGSILKKKYLYFLLLLSH